jgi:hypothetical protein
MRTLGVLFDWLIPPVLGDRKAGAALPAGPYLQDASPNASAPPGRESDEAGVYLQKNTCASALLAAQDFERLEAIRWL